MRSSEGSRRVVDIREMSEQFGHVMQKDGRAMVTWKGRGLSGYAWTIEYGKNQAVKNEWQPPNDATVLTRELVKIVYEFRLTESRMFS